MFDHRRFNPINNTVSAGLTKFINYPIWRECKWTYIVSLLIPDDRLNPIEIRRSSRVNTRRILKAAKRTAKRRDADDME